MQGANTLPLPFLSGVYTTGPGLVPLSKNGLPDNRIFDIDNQYDHYLDNKKECRKNLSLHFCTSEFSPATEHAACLTAATELARAYPDKFTFTIDGDKHILTNKIKNIIITWDKTLSPPSGYESVFDAIASQVQEDLAVFQLDGDRDWLAAIHLCSPNHWDPREKVGRPFPDIHTPVPAMERTVKQYKPMLQSVISRGPFARYAWGVDKDDKLNHHPSGPNRIPPSNPHYFIRMERQHLVGLPEVNAFLFTIRTYFYEVARLTPDERHALAAAIKSMTPASLVYKRMDGFADGLVRELEG